MWFKQVQLFKLSKHISSSSQDLADKLQTFEFTPCLPSMPHSAGFVAPIEEEDAPLARGINGCIMFCLQLEEKILPASVIAHTLKEKVKEIEARDARKIRQKEKLSLKDDVTHNLLPRAFTKFTRIHAYIDTRHQWLIVNTASLAKTELFLSLCKKALQDDDIQMIEVIKPSSLLTHWLKSRDYPAIFSIEKFCVLQDIDQQTRVVRCQQQDLFSDSIQSLVKDGCAAIQMALTWNDKLTFTLSEDFCLRSIRLAEDDLAEIDDQLETKQQKFDADFLMMSELYAGLLQDLLNIFTKSNTDETKAKLALVG